MISMITFFAIPKPFEGHIGMIQQNAIESWTRAIPDGEVILFGDETGTEQVAHDLGVRHIASIERNDYGTPLLSSAFRVAEQAARNEVLCYVNADIILTRTLGPAIDAVNLERYLLVGQRTDLEVRSPIVFDDAWSDQIIETALTNGRLRTPWAIDYFVFRKGTGLDQFPPFAVGRPGWDNWLISRARELSIPIVDLTADCRVIHQNHGYAHVKNARGGQWEGPEGDQNRKIARGTVHYSILSADYRLDGHRLRKNSLSRYLVRRVSHAIAKRLHGEP